MAPPGDNSFSNRLLDLLGPAVLAPAIVFLFWGSSSNTRVLTAAAVYTGLNIIAGLALWYVARNAVHRYQVGEMAWSCTSGLLAGSLPWIIQPQTTWGHYALGMIFATIMSSDTLFSALRPNSQWKSVLLGTSFSFGLYLAFEQEWVVGTCCVVFGIHLVGGHDAVQELVHTLRSAGARSEELAQTDPLTQLANRRGLHAYISESAERSDERLIVASLDIDDFKQINDRHGHTGGDVALIGLAKHLEKALGDHWLAIRSGGDEFMCVSTTGTVQEAKQALRSIPGQLFEGSVIPIKVSVGLAVGEPSDALLADASAALRLSKKRGKHRVTEVDDELRGRLRQARRLGAQLAEAVEKCDIEVWAQPIVHLAGSDNSIHSYECLARWSTPDGASIPPSTFIPMIEDQRLTRELGESMITRAAEFAVALDDDTAVSVNVSSSHFIDPSFTEYILHTLQVHNLEPRRLTIEITETEDLPSTENAWGVARQLRTMGVGLAIDDFGTGYASLERLIRFPCSQLKLDRSLINNAEGTGLEHLLAGFGIMSAESGVEIVAEGVETQSQADLLASIGLPLAQGYLFDHPRPVAQILAERMRAESEQTASLEPAAEAPQALSPRSTVSPSSTIAG